MPGAVARMGRYTAAWCACALVACAGEQGRNRVDAGFAARDSAGVTIAENTVAEPPGVPHWRVDSAPSFTIGVTEGDTAYEFGAIRGVRGLPNGMVVVLNGRGELAFEFRFFDSTGKHLASHGRLGQGPGEFRWVNFFGPAGGDTVIGVDFPNSRLTWVSASAGWLRSSRMDENGFRKLLGDDASGIVELMVPLGDSVYAVKAYRAIVGAASRAQRSQTFHIVDMKAGTRLNVAHFDDPPLRQVNLTSGPTYVWPAGAGIVYHAVDRGRHRLCATITRKTEITCVDSAGKRTLIRWTAETVRYTDADRDSMERAIRSGPASRSRTPEDLNSLIAATERPERHLPFRAMQLDEDGNFWILEVTDDREGARRSRFRVLDPDGRLTAFADPFPVRPYGANALHIGSRRVLRALENADGAPVVGVFPIHKPD